jgi:hypothetical protein
MAEAISMNTPVKHPSIPVSAFKPETKPYRQKVLRRFEDEDHIINSRLSVEEEHVGKYLLFAHCPSTSLAGKNPATGETIYYGTEGVDILDQKTVNGIEVAPTCILTEGCDFVIFQDSPIAKESCRKGVSPKH